MVVFFTIDGRGRGETRSISFIFIDISLTRVFEIVTTYGDTYEMLKMDRSTVSAAAFRRN